MGRRTCAVLSPPPLKADCRTVTTSAQQAARCVSMRCLWGGPIAAPAHAVCCPAEL